MKFKNKRSDIYVLFWLTIGLIVIDQVAKFLAGFYLGDPVVIIPGFFKLDLSLNPGFAFGIEANRFLMVAITGLLILFLIRLILTEVNLKKTTSIIICALILGGALSNFLDRAVTGLVIDFLSFKYWPAFNFADIFIVVGVILGAIFQKKVTSK